MAPHPLGIVYLGPAYDGKSSGINLVRTHFADIKYVDNSFPGLLLLLSKYKAMQQKKLSLVNVDRELAKIFKWNLLDDIMSIDEV